jgi:N-acetylglucosaminyldiphosphoundecaprenol N-acetyl-beta-D-mannosaminyltransferase
MDHSLLASYKNIFCDDLINIPEKKILINTINAHSFNITLIDSVFNKSLHEASVLLPDGISVVWALRFLTGKKLHKIAGIDLFKYEMERINQLHAKCFFLGSTPKILDKITAKAKKDFPNARVYTYSPPYKAEFSDVDTESMLIAINNVQPDVLFIGMTAPKQEKWAYENFNKIDAIHICSIGAVFDFYAGNIKRAPEWIIKIGFEWCYRLFSEPKRMWKRYLIGNTVFVKSILKEKFTKNINAE